MGEGGADERQKQEGEEEDKEYGSCHSYWTGKQLPCHRRPHDTHLCSTATRLVGSAAAQSMAHYKQYISGLCMIHIV